MPEAKALLALLEVSIGQSMPSSKVSNQSIARTLGKAVGISASASLIQLAFEPPFSVEPISPISSGLPGATVSVICVVGRAVEVGEAGPAALARAPVVAVEPGPVDVFVAGVVGGELLCSLLPESTLGHQTQVTLVAPTEVKMSCTWRQAVTNSPDWLPLTPSLQGNQLPFISQSKRRKKGWPQSRASSANSRM